MGILIDHFNALFPNRAATVVSGSCSIDETESVDQGNSFRQLNIQNFTGWQFDHFLVKDASSLFQTLWGQANNPSRCGILLSDCDGVLCEEDADGILTFYFVELKSSFHKQQILKAKNQVVGSSVKLRNLFSLLQQYDPAKIRIRGIIAAYEMSPEQLSYFKSPDSRDTAFCLKLYQDGIYFMPDANCNRYWKPLNVGEVGFSYIKVPAKAKSHTIDFNQLVF